MSTTPYTDAIISIPIRCEGPKVYTMAGRTITIHEVFLKISEIYFIQASSSSVGYGVGGLTWDAAEVLAKYLEKNPNIVKDKTILELGCGTALAGITAAYIYYLFKLLNRALGGKCTITDGMEKVIEIAQQNVIANCQDINPIPKVELLEWGVHDNNNEKYDVIIGSDLLYMASDFNALAETVSKHWKENTQFYLINFKRYPEREIVFYDIMKSKGYSYNTLDLSEVELQKFHASCFCKIDK